MIELRQYCYIAAFAFFIALLGFSVFSLMLLIYGCMAFEYEDLDELEYEGELTEKDLFELPWYDIDWKDYFKSTKFYAKNWNENLNRKVIDIDVNLKRKNWILKKKEKFKN